MNIPIGPMVLLFLASSILGCNGSSTTPSQETYGSNTFVSECSTSVVNPLRFTVNNSIASVSGVSCDGSPKAFSDMLDSHSIRKLTLNNIEGSIDDDANFVLGRLIRDAGIATSVTASSHVTSGGVDLFLAGASRQWSEGAKLGVHSWSDGSVDGSSYPIGSPEHNKYKKYYEDMGIPVDFYWYTLNAASSSEMHYMTSEELKRFKVIPQRFVSSGVTATFIETRSHLISEAEQLNVAVYSLAKEHVDVNIHGMDVEWSNLGSRNPKNEIKFPYFRSGGIQALDSNSKKFLGLIAGWNLLGVYHSSYKEKLNALIIVYPKIDDFKTFDYSVATLDDDGFIEGSINYNFFNTTKFDVQIEYQCDTNEQVLSLKRGGEFNLSCSKTSDMTLLKLNGVPLEATSFPDDNAYVIIESF